MQQGEAVSVRCRKEVREEEDEWTRAEHLDPGDAAEMSGDRAPVGEGSRGVVGGSTHCAEGVGEGGYGDFAVQGFGRERGEPRCEDGDGEESEGARKDGHWDQGSEPGLREFAR